jgi:putative peptidoglycan lipid II flippase
MVRAAGLISGLTLVSRLLGLAREQAFAALLGASLHADAFQIGFRVPNLLRDLFAEGALSAAFVPTYTASLHAGGRASAYRLANRLLTLLAVALALVVLAGYVLAGPLVAALAPGYERVPGKREITITLTRVMLPFLPLVSFAAVAMGMLNAREKYGAPAVAPAMFNVVAIVWAGALWALGFDERGVAMGWAWGTLVGGAAQFLIQVPPLRRDGWRFRPEWAPGDEGIRRILALMAPATIGLAAVQLNLFISSRFASHEPGAVSWLQYAFRILYLPIGLFGVALGTIAATGLARRAASGDLDGLRQTIRQSLRLLAFLTIPATLGVMVLRVEVVRLIYERGAFGPSDTDATANALLFYSIGLVAYSGVKILAPAFYAIGAPGQPLLGSGLAVVTNLVVIFALHGALGYRGVALGTALGSIVNILVLGGGFQRRVGGLAGHGLLGAASAMGLAALLMAPVAALSASALASWLGTRGLGAQLATGLVPVVIGAATYIAVSKLLGIPEADAVLSLVLRRRARAHEKQGG